LEKRKAQTSIPESDFERASTVESFPPRKCCSIASRAQYARTIVEASREITIAVAEPLKPKTRRGLWRAMFHSQSNKANGATVAVKTNHFLRDEKNINASLRRSNPGALFSSAHVPLPHAASFARARDATRHESLAIARNRDRAGNGNGAKQF